MIRTATSSAAALAKDLAAEGEHDTIVVKLSGRGDRDVEQAAELFRSVAEPGARFRPPPA